MKIYNVSRKQFLPVTIEEAWDFFSSPDNLLKITPGNMQMKPIYSSGGASSYEGKIIRYKITILPFISVFWLTEITHFQLPQYFVDEQRFGPFSFWHHQHHFKAVAGGVEMWDEVNYALPLGFLGRIAHAIFVGRQIKTIFDYRRSTLETHFGKDKK